MSRIRAGWRRFRSWPLWVQIVLAILVIGLIGAAGGAGKKDKTASTTTTPSTTAPSTTNTTTTVEATTTTQPPPTTTARPTTTSAASDRATTVTAACAAAWRAENRAANDPNADEAPTQRATLIACENVDEWKIAAQPYQGTILPAADSQVGLDQVLKAMCTDGNEDTPVCVPC